MCNINCSFRSVVSSISHELHYLIIWNIIVFGCILRVWKIFCILGWDDFMGILEKFDKLQSGRLSLREIMDPQCSAADMHMQWGFCLRGVPLNLENGFTQKVCSSIIVNLITDLQVCTNIVSRETFTYERIEAGSDGHREVLSERDEREEQPDNHVHDPGVQTPVEERQVHCVLCSLVVWISDHIRDIVSSLHLVHLMCQKRTVTRFWFSLIVKAFVVNSTEINYSHKGGKMV